MMVLAELCGSVCQVRIRLAARVGKELKISSRCGRDISPGCFGVEFGTRLR
jgi:hypothetical protein